MFACLSPTTASSSSSRSSKVVWSAFAFPSHSARVFSKSWHASTSDKRKFPKKLNEIRMPVSDCWQRPMLNWPPSSSSALLSAARNILDPYPKIHLSSSVKKMKILRKKSKHFRKIYKVSRRSYCYCCCCCCYCCCCCCCCCFCWAVVVVVAR